jgi:hypothetical protein
MNPKFRYVPEIRIEFIFLLFVRHERKTLGKPDKDY